MLLSFHRFCELKLDQLMQVYIEGNMENGAENYPEQIENRQLQLAEQDFADYLRRDFFSVKGARYYVWMEDSEYISALRVEPYMDGLLLCALETKPSRRRMGYAKRLICSVLDALDVPVYSHISKRNKASIAAHVACGFCKLHEGAKYLDGSVTTLADTYIYKK